jgi:hypothetical protein
VAAEDNKFHDRRYKITPSLHSVGKLCAYHGFLPPVVREVGPCTIDTQVSLMRNWPQKTATRSPLHGSSRQCCPHWCKRGHFWTPPAPPTNGVDSVEPPFEKASRTA